MPAPFIPPIEILIQLTLALLLGGVLGLQREISGKPAGLRTYALVALGATLFTIISRYGFLDLLGQEGIRLDPSRVAAQIVVGVGFIGAGLIIFRGMHIEGLTTAAGLWSAAAIGMAVGVKFYGAALFATLLVFVALELLGKLKVEEWLERRSRR